MLQAISNAHDIHFASDSENPLADLVAAREDGKKHLLLAASGSVATIKIPEIIKSLSRHDGEGSRLSIRVILTDSARHFLAGQSKEQPTVNSLVHLPNVEAVYDDAAEWGPQPWRRGQSILHIELRRWADLLVVAPLSANTLAKVVNGMSDNLLTSVIRAWDTDCSIDGKKKLIAVAPAMNSAMWRHPITSKQIRVLQEDWGFKESSSSSSTDGELVAPDANGWFQVLMPISKTLACGDTGDGAMASVDTIREAIETRLNLVD